MPLTKVKSGGVSDSITLTSPDINAPDIDGGTIDNAVIGGSTAAAGSFTTITATGGSSSNWNTAYGWGDHSTQSYATQTYVGTEVSNLVDSSPAALDTLNELAAALGDDPNFATTVTNSIALKAPLASPSFTGTATMDGVEVSDTDDIRIRLLNGATFKAGIQVATTAGDMIAGSAVDDLAIRAQTNMLFATGGNTERMRITSSGNVGIGVSPSSEFHVKGDAATVARVEPNNNSGKATLLVSSTGSGDGGIQYDANNNNMHLFSYSNMTFNVGTGNVSGGYPANERMRIDSSGKIQIGNNIPMWSGSYGGALFLKGNNATSDRYAQLTIVDSAGAIAQQGLIVSNTGNVGIGVSTPYSRLQVLDEARVSSASNTAGKLAFGDGGTGNDNVGIWRGAANSVSGGNWLNLGAWGDSGITFSVGSAVFGSKTERMRIDASGDLIKVGGVIKGERGTAAAPPYTFSDDTDTGMFNISNADLGFSVGGTERMRIHASGAVTKPYQPSTVFTSSSGITLYHDSVWRKIPLNSTKHQTGGNHFSTSNNRFTAPVAGRYLFGMDIQLESVVGNIVWMYLVPLVNGNRNANNGQAFADFTPSNTTYNRQTGTFLLNLSANDYVEMWHIGSGNGTVVLKPNAESSFFLTLL